MCEPLPAFQDRCRGIGPDRSAPQAEVPGVTLSDVASFAPEGVSVGTEPSGWALMRRPFNVFASGEVHERAGELLGQPAVVRFTPVEWVWDFGDGSVVSTSAGGASWAALGVPEFSETATSHFYRERGTYAASVTVSYSAEFQIGGSAWIPVEGTVDVVTSLGEIRVFRARTVLVAEDCIQNPYGRGC